jgi:D-3-phosphoglycerate dehydrogenase
MKKILIATTKPFSKTAVSAIREIVEGSGNECLLLEKYASQDELIDAVQDIDAMIIRSDIVDKAVIDAAKKLKIVVRAGAGYDNVDLSAATQANVVVMNTPGQNSNAVAELAFGMMVYLNRGCFDGSAGTELRGKTLGIHAYGYVGRLVGMIGKGFGMDVFAFDPFIDASVIEKDGIKRVESAEELYAGCQYVSLHIPANSETKESIGFELLNSMPAGATLVNTARKEVIHEPSLLKAFAERHDFRYISDIAPGCAPEIETNYKGRYFFTPKKMGAQTAEANMNAGLAAARQIIAFFDKGDTRFKVN